MSLVSPPGRFLDGQTAGSLAKQQKDLVAQKQKQMAQHVSTSLLFRVKLLEHQSEKVKCWFLLHTPQFGVPGPWRKRIPGVCVCVYLCACEILGHFMWFKVLNGNPAIPAMPSNSPDCTNGTAGNVIPLCVTPEALTKMARRLLSNFGEMDDLETCPNPFQIGCFQKLGYPKMDGLEGKTLLELMIWGYPYFWKHPDWKTTHFHPFSFSLKSPRFSVFFGDFSFPF